MKEQSYEDKYPYGVQTVVPTNPVGNQKGYQVNTRTRQGWWISNPVKASEVRKTLKAQSKRFTEHYCMGVDTRYVLEWYGSRGV